MNRFSPKQNARLAERGLDPQSVETYRLSRAVAGMRFENPGEQVDVCPVVDQQETYRLIALPDGVLLPIQR